MRMKTKKREKSSIGHCRDETFYWHRPDEARIWCGYKNRGHEDWWMTRSSSRASHGDGDGGFDGPRVRPRAVRDSNALM